MITFKYPEKTEPEKILKFENIEVGEFFQHRFEDDDWEDGDDEIYVKLDNTEIEDNQCEVLLLKTMTIENISLTHSKFRTVNIAPIEILSYSDTIN